MCGDSMETLLSWRMVSITQLLWKLLSNATAVPVQIADDCGSETAFICLAITVAFGFPILF
jgi:hypothetical protein